MTIGPADDYFERQNTRDQSFLMDLAVGVHAIAKYLNEWITKEISVLVYEAQQLEVNAPENLKPIFREIVDELQDINLGLAVDAWQSADQRVENLKRELMEGGAEDGPLEAYYSLVDCLSSLERTMRRLLRMRSTVDGFLI